jgi:hypothetical protein
LGDVLVAAAVTAVAPFLTIVKGLGTHIRGQSFSETVRHAVLSAGQTTGPVQESQLSVDVGHVLSTYIRQRVAGSSKGTWEQRLLPERQPLFTRIRAVTVTVTTSACCIRDQCHDHIPRHHGRHHHFASQGSRLR